MRPRAVAALVAATAALAATVAGPATAVTPQPRTTVTAVEQDVMCVVCGVPLEVAESPAADDERRFIARLVARGETKAQIERQLVAQYGSDVLATPSASGFDAAVWIVPGAAVVAVLAVLAFVVPRWRRRRVAPAAAPATSALDPADVRRLDEDLARFEG